jgi:hypothetical protein
MRRLTAVLLVAVLAIVAVFVVHRILTRKSSLSLPSNAALASMTLDQRIVAIAESQLSYKTSPSDSYCNKFSFYWNAGGRGCPSGEESEKWCADFAAWVWRHAGVRFPYGYSYGDINGGAASFYVWGEIHGTWHPMGGGYTPSPGDVAVYGLSLSGSPWAAHVAVVTDDPPSGSGPSVVNGDGDRTGFSVVESGTHQTRIVVGHTAYTLTGYVSP